MKNVEDIISFVKENPWQGGGQWSEAMLRIFFKQLISSEEMIFDFHTNSGRVAVAVLLDKVQNKGNFTNLEILTISNQNEEENVLDEILKWAKKRSPDKRIGFEIGFPFNYLKTEIIKKHNLSLYYETYEMENENPNKFGQEFQEIISLKSEEKGKEIYDLLCLSFKDNIDTNISPYEDWLKSQRAQKGSKFWGYYKNGKIVGFVNLIISDDHKTAEIRTVGVLSIARNQGIGKKLIQHALYFVGALQISNVRLTVALQNKNALNLYLQLGFIERKKYQICSWKRD